MLLKIFLCKKKISTLTYHIFFLNLNFYTKAATVVERLWMKPYGAVDILVHSDNMTFILDLFLTALISLTWWLVEIFPESVDACILQRPSFWATLQNSFCVCGYSFLALLKLWTFFKYFEKFISFLSCCERPYIKLFTLKCCNMVKAVRLTVKHDTALGIWFSACNSFLLPQFGRKLTVVRRLRLTSMNYTNVYHYKSVKILDSVVSSSKSGQTGRSLWTI